MLDPKLIRQDPTVLAKQLARRGYHFDVALFNQLEEQRRAIQLKTQELQSQRNQFSKAIGQAKAKGESVADLLTKVAHVGDELTQAEANLEKVQQSLQDFLLQLPNILDDSVPDGKDASSNVEVRRWGEPKQFTFPVKDHVTIGEALGGVDFAAAAKLSGSRFSVLRGPLAQLQRALGQFMLDLHTSEHHYQEVYVPYLVHPDMLYGTGQLPKFKEDFFYLAGEKELCLIPTAEIPLSNLARELILNAEDLPVKLTAQTPCFRSEAGSYGKDTRGMIRQHQFEKVELVQLVKPQDSAAALEVLTSHAERVLQELDLPYRVMLLSAGDTGFSAAKTYDIEVWLPAQNCYREISSCSNCTDFQARRMQARWRENPGAKPELLHTLNGSGVAIGRALVAIMENYQDQDGHVHIPLALQKYMPGIRMI